MPTNRLRMVDLFCGAGGTSTGAAQAAQERGIKLDLLAVNHWDLAIATHSANHPSAKHIQNSIDTINPRDFYKPGEIDILWASPECMNHSRAKGGKPINDQSRATAHCVTRWADATQPGAILVENVKEFREWAPLGVNGKPLKSKRGQVFDAWVATLQALGYRVDWRILNSADYGDPQARERLIVQAVRGRRKIRWPEQTHFPVPGNLFGQKQWVPAREIINWNHPSRSIFGRERPLSQNTLRRIEIGLKKFGLKPFMVPQQRRHVVRDLDRPLPTIVGTSRGEGLCEPFLVHVNHGGGDERRVKPLDQPLPTVTASRGMGICEPFLIRVGHYGKGGKGAIQVKRLDEPLTTITTKQEHALCEPFLIHLRGTAERHIRGGSQTIDLPLPTITGGGVHVGLCEPFLTKFYGTGGANSIDEPLDTVTCNDRFGLVMPEIVIDGERYLLDIHFRMFQPDELALGQGFPPGYRFCGNKTEQTKQIGNAVPCGLSRAVVGAVIDQ